MRFRATIPNDYNSGADAAELTNWCESHGIDPPTASAIFDALESAWPEAEPTDDIGDWHIIFDAPMAPPPSADVPPLWFGDADK